MRSVACVSNAAKPPPGSWPSNDKLRPYQVQPEKADAGISDKSSAKGMTNRSWKLFNF